MKNKTALNHLWSSKEFCLADFNDARLTKRCIGIATGILDNPSGSIAESLTKWKKIKGAYRFFNNESVTNEKILSSHIEMTNERCQMEKVVLVAQDTTELTTSPKKVSGAGKIGVGKSEGFFIHTGLALTTNGIPLGIVSQKIYARKAETSDPSRNYKKLDIKDKETYKWVECINGIKKNLKGVRVVVIGDRESDIYDVFRQAKDLEVEVLIRVAQNRLVKDTEDAEETEHLFDKVKKEAIVTQYELEVPNIENGHKKRTAKLSIRKSKYILLPPRSRDQKLPHVELSLIDVLEENSPKGTEAIHWMLATNIEVNTANDCIELIKWYTQRWKVERFHYVLKTGLFNVEKLQFRTKEGLSNVLSMFSILAYRILYLTYIQRESPDLKATEVITSEECNALKKLNDIENEKELTISEAVRYISRLGGFLNRKGDKHPGVKVMWKGLKALHFVVIGMQLSSKNN